MSTRTRAELVTLALDNLGAIGAGQTAQIEDTQRVNDVAPSIMETLRATEVYYLNDIENIPEAAYVPLAAILAWGCRAKFSITDPNELAMLQQAAETGTAALKVMTRGRPTYQVLQTDFM